VDAFAKQDNQPMCMNRLLPAVPALHSIFAGLDNARANRAPDGIRWIVKKKLSTRLFLMLALVVFLPCKGGGAEKDGGFILYSNLSGSAGPVEFSHRSHDTRGAGYACDRCHAGEPSAAQIAGMDEIRLGRGCGSCHDGRTRGPQSSSIAASIQDCSACHMPAGDIVITLNRMDAVAFSHVRHLGVDAEEKVSKAVGFSCSDCHPVPFERASNSPIGMEVPHEIGGCAQCHNGQKRNDGMEPAFAATAHCLTCHKPSDSM
jgi:c(7)-type cytochrome triheme protein